MSQPVAPQTAIIVGASRGIGAALARELARRGYTLGLLSRNQEQLDQLAAELRSTCSTHVETGTLDVCDQTSVAPALQHLFLRQS